MLEFRKNSLLDAILDGKTVKTIVEKVGIRKTRKKIKQEPPKLGVRREIHGARVVLQEMPPAPKWKTLAFVANSGKITYYTKESSLKPEYINQIERLSKLASAGKKINR